MPRKNKYEFLWLALIIATFFVLNCFSIHTGDDLGYMFADTTHHSGDGVRVTSLAQCFSTQCHHYVTTNGRFLVHVLVMALLNLVPISLYRLLNAFMFGVLWLLTCRLVAPSKRSFSLYAVAWFLLLVAIPQPGLVLLTLVSYSVNYMWVGVAVVAFLLALQRKVSSKWFILYAAFVGSLQESFSLPLCAALFLGAILKRVPIPVVCAFIVGTAVEVFAPGNMAHAAQGGGFSLAALSHKLTALGADLCYSIIAPAALAALVWLCLQRKKAILFLNENIILVTAIIAALLLAMLTFTSPRQLTAPTLFTIILLLKLLPDNKYLATASVVATVAVMTIMGIYKYQIKSRYDSLIDCVRSGYTVVFPKGETPCSANNTFTRAFIPDPLCNRGLVAIGDKYTKQGLSRLRGEKSIKTILPYSPQHIANLSTNCHITDCGDSLVVTTSSVAPFAVAAVPNAIYSSMKIHNLSAFECFKLRDSVYVLESIPTKTVSFLRKPQIK